MKAGQHVLHVVEDRSTGSQLERDNVVYWKEPKGRSKMISNATNLLKESVLGCAGYASIHALFVISL